MGPYVGSGPGIGVENMYVYTKLSPSLLAVVAVDGGAAYLHNMCRYMAMHMHDALFSF